MFVHLHCHSHYSFLRGVASPLELVAAAAEQKMPAVALTDTNGMYAAVPFYLAAHEAGVKPIVGVAVDVERDQSVDGGEIPRLRANENHRASARHEEKKHGLPMVLLAADAEGYSNLCRLVTRRQIGRDSAEQEGTAGAARNRATAQDTTAEEEEGAIVAAKDEGEPLTVEDLAEHSKRVIALCPPSSRWPNASDRRGTIYRAPTKEWIARLKEIFGEQLYLEAQLLSPGDRRALRETERLGRELGVPLVATNNAHFLRPEEHLHHRALNAIRTGGLLTTVAPPEIMSSEAWFKPAAEMERLFADHPEAVRATLEIAERCNLQLKLGKLIFPEFPVPEGETPFSYLW